MGPLMGIRRRVRVIGARWDARRRAPTPFVAGVSRSGTTLLRLMLDAHPQLTIPPEAHFVPLIRDGRDVALSLNEVSWGPGGISAAAHKWVDELQKARTRARGLMPGTYMEARYEDLVADPEPVLRRIAEFVDLPWDE